MVLPQLNREMFSHGWRSMSRKIQLTTLPDASGNKNVPRKCHSHTRAYVSTVLGPACVSRLSKRSMSHYDVTPEVFLKFAKTIRGHRF
jgi:hypothetical protein